MARGPLVGQRIRKRRRELGQSQAALAASVDISPSYLNLIEHNKRRIGGALLRRIVAALGLDSRDLAGTEEDRLMAELGEVAADIGQIGIEITPRDASEVIASSPHAARAILGLYRAYREARLRSDLLGERLGEDSFLAETSQQIVSLITTIRSYAEILKDYGDLSSAERTKFAATLVGETETLAARAIDMVDFMSGHGGRRPRPAPREEIEDFISDRANYFPSLEALADQTLARLACSPTLESLSELLQHRHGIRVEFSPAEMLPPDGEGRDGATFLLSEAMSRSSARFRIARLLGTLTYGERLDALIAEAAPASQAAALGLRRALASYFAGALLMPYAPFRAAIDTLRLDITRIGHRFDASFEQVCQRLTTMRQPGSEAIPLHFLRTDIAGNISKRFSASGLRLPRYGGACSRWIIHHAFTAPGRILTQVARLPGGETFFFVARASVPQSGVGAGERSHAVMIGCAIEHAHRFVYADGLNLAVPQVAVPVGITCRQCTRQDCSQRVFDRVVPPESASARLPTAMTQGD
jgi:predicted transcriptional regulator/transcriptional regulator with XRE-family HTH domain